MKDKQVHNTAANGDNKHIELPLTGGMQSRV